MSKKKKKFSIGKITSEQQFEMSKPKWNGYNCGTGVHGDVSYNRRKFKKDTNHIINEDWQH
jgi:hypothetical protein